MDINNIPISLKPYPSFACWECAEQTLRNMGQSNPVAEPGIEYIRGRCDVCGEIRTVADPVEFDSPEFVGFVPPWSSFGNESDNDD